VFAEAGSGGQVRDASRGNIRGNIQIVHCVHSVQIPDDQDAPDA
jgi:hypothetical protein